MFRRVVSPLGSLVLLMLIVGLAPLFHSGTAFAQRQLDTTAEDSAEAEPSAMATGIDTPTRADQSTLGPENISDQEITLFLENLRRRERELEAREQALQNQQEALAAIAAELEVRFGELQEIRDQINEQLLAVDNARAVRIQSLGSWYAAMEPKQAAEQLGTQEIETVVDVFMSMEERKASAVLESMDVAVAAQVIEEMSRRN